MLVQNSPSCNCCGDPCIIHGAFADLETCSGAWTNPSAGVYSTGDDDALLKSPNTGNSDEPWHVKAIIQVQDAVGVSDFQVRVVGGLLDCDNYCAIEYNLVSFRLISVTGGVVTELANSRQGVGCPSGSAVTNIIATLNLFWDGLRLIGWIAPEIRVSSGLFTPAGWGAGAGCGSLSGADAFSVFGLTHRYTSSASRPTCDELSSSACQGDVPIDLLLEITGASGTVSFCNGTHCSFDCSNLNGTHTLSLTPLGLDCYSNGFGYWSYLDQSVPVTCDFSVDCMFSVVDILYEVEVDPGDPVNRTIEVNIETPAGLLEAQIAVDDPCEDWTDWIDLTITGGPCTSGMTMRIKKA